MFGILARTNCKSPTKSSCLLALASCGNPEYVFVLDEANASLQYKHKRPWSQLEVQLLLKTLGWMLQQLLDDHFT